MRFLGVATFLARYMPNCSELTTPFRQLLNKENAFVWREEQQKAFEDIKRVLFTAPVLQYYDVNKPITVQCDSSQDGICCVLLQDGKLIEYASRALTNTEQSWAQIEKELLSVVLKRFHTYVYGHQSVTVENDYKPLQSIRKQSLISAPKRLYMSGDESPPGGCLP